MQTFREAADAILSAKKKHPGLLMRVTIETYGAQILGIMGNRELERTVSWDDMQNAHANVLAISIGDVAREISR